MPARIGISLGDVTGIGPEVTLKALAAELPVDDTRYVVIGDVERLRCLDQCLGLGLPIGTDRISVGSPLPTPLPATMAAGDAAAARAAMAWLEEAARRCLRKELDAMITAPVNKEAIVKAGFDFVGQTEFLTALDGNSETAMMLLGHDERGRWLRVALVTTHVPIKRVAECLTRPGIERVIALAASACRLLGLPRARVAVCGLNPHAGEGGKMGTEEQTMIAPAVGAARARNLDVSGPFSADSLFYYVLRGDYDAVVAMYHDQGLVPLKMIGFETGVNWTLGLSFIRTSPDHGTAYDIAGKGVANPSSMIAALRLARKLAGNRTG